MWVLGSELRCSCLLDKHLLIKRALSYLVSMLATALVMIYINLKKIRINFPVLGL